MLALPIWLRQYLEGRAVRNDLRWYQPAYWIRGLTGFYQTHISSRTGANCRYRPTCSAYAVEAVETPGAGRGGGAAMRRVARCTPGSTDGFAHDPVQPRREVNHV